MLPVGSTGVNAMDVIDAAADGVLLDDPYTHDWIGALPSR